MEVVTPRQDGAIAAWPEAAAAGIRPAAIVSMRARMTTGNALEVPMAASAAAHADIGNCSADIGDCGADFGNCGADIGNCGAIRRGGVQSAVDGGRDWLLSAGSERVALLRNAFSATLSTTAGAEAAAPLVAVGKRAAAP